MRNRTSDLRIPRSNALSVSHRDSMVSEVYYEVHMTHVLHTTRINNVDSVMFVDSLSHVRDKMKTSFFNSLPSSKLTISLISILWFIVSIDCRIKLWVTNRDVWTAESSKHRPSQAMRSNDYTSILMLHDRIMVNCHCCMHFGTP